jgi:uncharacterized tellurite resistance protein B-like protein
MNFKSTIIQLYYLLIYSDGKVNQGELALGKKMIQAEGISETEFERHLTALKGRDTGLIYKECLDNLRRLKRSEQIRCIAWLCVLANSDGFMDRAEWQFIYKVYHKDLKLPLDEIMEVKKQLSYSTRDALFVLPAGQAASTSVPLS